MKSLGPTERDQDEGQGQGPASSRAEKMKNEEIKHTTRQPRACEPNRRHGGARRRGSTSTRRRMRPQQGRQDRGTAELKLLQFPRSVSGKRSNTNIKFYATSTKTQIAGGEEEDASESGHGGENEDENNKDKSFKKADSTSQPKNISHGNCVSCDAKVSKTNTMKK